MQEISESSPVAQTRQPESWRVVWKSWKSVASVSSVCLLGMSEQMCPLGRAMTALALLLQWLDVGRDGTETAPHHHREDAIVSYPLFLVEEGDGQECDDNVPTLTLAGPERWSMDQARCNVRLLTCDSVAGSVTCLGESCP